MLGKPLTIQNVPVHTHYGQQLDSVSSPILRANMRSDRKPSLLAELEPDPTVSLGPIIALLVLVGFAFLFLGDEQVEERRRVSFLLLAMLWFISAGVAAFLGHLMPLLARWIIVIVLALVPVLN